MEDTFRSLEVFKKAHALVLDIYQVTAMYPSEEKHSLTSQLRRAASSVPANIVEGLGRSGRQERIHFFYIANGSLEEVKYFLLLSKDLTYLSGKEYETLHEKTISVGKLLQGFISYTKKRNSDL